MSPCPTRYQLAKLAKLNAKAGNLWAGTFNRTAYEKALAYYRKIFFTKEATKPKVS